MELCCSNPCSGWRLKGVKSGYKAIIVTPEQTLAILKSMTNLLHFTIVRRMPAFSSFALFSMLPSCGYKTANE